MALLVGIGGTLYELWEALSAFPYWKIVDYNYFPQCESEVGLNYLLGAPLVGGRESPFCDNLAVGNQ